MQEIKYFQIPMRLYVSKVLKNAKMIKETIQNDKSNIVTSKIKYLRILTKIYCIKMFLGSQNIDIEEQDRGNRGSLA